MFNCHVDDAFTFTPDEIQFMPTSWITRAVVWPTRGVEHANFGTDPLWCAPIHTGKQLAQAIELK